jgi:hypothetical protein
MEKMKSKWIVISAVILGALLVFLFFPIENRDIPENLIGKWITSEPNYQDRFIEITKETFVYGLGGDKLDVYFISNLKANLKNNEILYTISYKNKNGLKFTRSFYYYPENGGLIQFRHQEHIKWMKEKDVNC